MTVGIVGAGLAGLTCGIRLRLAGIPVTIFEKGRIPVLKVCGEYLSVEVLPLLEKLGVSLLPSRFPLIDRLTCTAGSQQLDRPLPLGGLGISRQALDGALKDRFLQLGGILREQAAVASIHAKAIRLKDDEAEHRFDWVVNASGRLNPFSEKRSQAQALYVGYKKQVPAQGWPLDRIHLEFYPWGYFGCSSIEDDRVCICMLVRQEHLKSLRSIDQLMDTVHLEDPLLETIFHQPGKTVAVSNFQFYTYRQSDQPTIGDAGGNIPPVVGNGMSLAILSGNAMAESLAQGKPADLTDKNNRIRAGLFLNELSMSSCAALGVSLLENPLFPMQEVVALTHGRPI